MNKVISRTIIDQINHQDLLTNQVQKDSGVFFTNELSIIDSILDVIDFKNGIIDKKILEPAVGNGIFLLRIIERAYKYHPNKEIIGDFIENGLYFVDINSTMVENTMKNIRDLYKNLFDEEYQGRFNAFINDFTEKSGDCLTLFDENENKELENLFKKMDYTIGNPPYVTLYGRRDRKKSEQQRVNYLNKYKQFPRSVRNGKINYVMLFLEHGLDLLKNNGVLSYIIDISFFETAYKYTREFLLKSTKILSLEKNISNFDGVASGQLIIKLQKSNKNTNHIVTVKDFLTEDAQMIKQTSWLNENDEYKFRSNFSKVTSNILDKIAKQAPETLKNQHPKKALRTCTMLLNMENKFVNSKNNKGRKCNFYKYYRGSKSLYAKYCNLFSNKIFYYDKALQDKINDKLKEELTKKGIKNKKRIGLGDFLVYNNPKVFIRQSAKEIITSYDEGLSAANNSLYVFSLKKDDKETKKYLRFLCGYLNSKLTTFYSQKREIIRYRKGKQPQIKISDLYSIPVPRDTKLIDEISTLVKKIYEKTQDKNKFINKIDQRLFEFFELTPKEVRHTQKSIEDFLKF